jgi:hypothetical protein
MSKSTFTQLVSIEKLVKDRIHMMKKGARLRSNWEISQDIINPLDDIFLSCKTKEIFGQQDFVICGDER